MQITTPSRKEELVKTTRKGAFIFTCDDPSCETRFFGNTSETLRPLTNRAVNAGWYVDTNKRHYCPQCVSELKHMVTIAS